MAILKDTLIQGACRVIGDAYFNAIKSGVWNGTAVAISYGGTGATTASGARTNLGIGSVGTLNYGSDTTKYLRNDGSWLVPPNTKVTLNNTTSNLDYRILLSKSANNTNETDTVYKSGNLTFNPSTGVMKIGSNTIYHEGNLILPRTPVLNIVPQEASSGLPYIDLLFGTMPTYLLSFCNGRPLHNDPCFKKDTNDVRAYTQSPYTSTIYREEIGSSGEYELQVRLMNSSGSVKSLTNLGGWYFGDLCKRFTQYVCIFLANIPVGCTVEYNGNSTGGFGETKRFWLTSNEGTGKMEWYGYFLVTDAHGEDSDFSTINFYRIYNSSGLNNNAAVWVKIRYAQVFELTDGNYIGSLRSRFTDNLQRNVIIKSGTTATVQINSFEDDYVLIPDSGKTITVNINFDPVSSDVGKRITIYKPLYAGTGQLSFRGNNATHYYYKYISNSTATGGTIGNSNVNLGNGNKIELIYLGVISSKYYWLFLIINIG